MHLGIDIMREVQALCKIEGNRKDKIQKIIDDLIVYARQYLIAVCMSTYIKAL